MTAAELRRQATELGLDVVGAGVARPYEATEEHIVARRARGLFADMRFTMARPEVSCHPERLFPGARTVVSAALSYYVPAPEPGEDEGCLARYTWRDEYALLRVRLHELGQWLGGRFRVLVDDNDHVDRAAAARAGVCFYGKNTMTITPTHGSWVVLGTLVSEVEIEPTPALDLDCGDCTLCIDACPTGALDQPVSWTPRSVSRTGRRRLRPFPKTCDPSLVPWCMDATSARTYAPGTGRSSVVGRRRSPMPKRARLFRSVTGSSETEQPSWPSSTACTCRGTIRAGFAGMR
jgi:epoxyqueuosine reductase